MSDIVGTSSSDVLAGTAIDDVISGGNGNDWLSGGEGDDLLLGGRGSDTLLGGEGDDILRGGAGTDWLDGGEGVDLIDFSDGNAGIYFVLQQGTSTSSSGYWSTGNLGGGLGTDYYQDIEGVIGTNHADIILGSQCDDYIYGGGGRDLLLGNAGNDLLSGGNGNDLLLGGAGDDLISGGSGRDILYGGSGNDIIAGLDDAVDPNTGEAGGDLVYGDGADSLLGIVFGCFGGYPAPGADTIYAGNGNDLIFGDNGNNLSGSASGGDDEIHGGNGRDAIYGEGGSDTLYGEGGSDKLYGGAGDDILVGGAGADLLVGGAGSDTFVYLDRSDSPNSDEILDFTQGMDFLDFSALLGDEDLGWGGTQHAAKSVWYEASGGNTVVFADTDGDLANGADLHVMLKGVNAALTMDDFVGVGGDVTPPELTVNIVADALNDAAGSSLVTFEFSEAVAGFDVSDVSFSGGTLSDFSGSGKSYSATFTADNGSDTPGSVSVAEASYTDLAGNLGGAGSDTVAVDTRNPTLTVNIVDASLNDGDASSVVTFEFSEDVAGFVEGDVSFSGGALSDFTKVDGNSYTAVFTANNDSDTPGSVSVAAGDYTDEVGNLGGAGSDSVTIDTKNPTVTVTFEDASLNDSGNFSLVTFTFSEATDDFHDSDVAVVGGSLTGFSGSGASYSALFTANDDTDGTGSVTVIGGSFSDAAGNAGVAGSGEVEIDTKNPTLTVSIVADTLNVASDNSLVTFEFSEDVEGFALGDVSYSGGALDEFTKLDGNSYSAVFTAAPGVDTIGSVSVAAGSYTDEAGNTGEGDSDDVEIDTLLPTFLSISDDEDEVANIAGGDVVFTFQFSEDVSGFDASDIEIEHGTAGAFTQVDDDTYTLVVTPEADFDGDLQVKVAEGAAQDDSGNASPEAKVEQAVDTLAPTAIVDIKAISNDTGRHNNDFITNDTSLVVSGTHDSLGDGDKVQVSSDGGSTWADATLGANDTWSFDFQATQDGTYDFRARVVDEAGNAGTADTQAIVVDTTPASDIRFAFADVPSSMIAGTLIATLSATAPDTYWYTLESSSVASGSGTAAFVTAISGIGEPQLRLAPGKMLGVSTEYSVTVKVTDLAGNEHSEAIGIYSGNNMAADGFSAADGKSYVLYTYGLNDALAGADHDDALFGGAGNDTLYGGAGADLLSGNAGNDVFDYNAITDSPSGAGNRDVIIGFTAGSDDIDLSGIDANSSTADDDAFVFVDAPSSGIKMHQVTWHQAGGYTFVHGDVDGDTTTAEFEIQLAGNVALTIADFVL